MRRGFRAFVGGSFAEIFFGNCVALGLPCVTLAPADLASLIDSVELDPAQEVIVDLEALTRHVPRRPLRRRHPRRRAQPAPRGQLERDRRAARSRRRHRARRRRLPYVAGLKLG